MQIDIQARDFTLTPDLRGYVERRLRFGISHLQKRRLRINVRLSDVNGPKGGADKRCLLQIRADGVPEIIVQDTQVDLYDAITRAVERAGRTLRRSQRRTGSAINELWLV